MPVMRRWSTTEAFINEQDFKCSMFESECRQIILLKNLRSVFCFMKFASFFFLSEYDLVCRIFRFSRR